MKHSTAIILNSALAMSVPAIAKELAAPAGCRGGVRNDRVGSYGVKSRRKKRKAQKLARKRNRIK